MIILGIDTSCDETSVSILDGQKLVVQRISSQVSKQRQWGGVVPMLAQRMHQERIELVITEALAFAATRLNWPNQTSKKLSSLKQQLANQLATAPTGQALDKGAIKNKIPQAKDQGFTSRASRHEINFNSRQPSYHSAPPHKAFQLNLLPQVKNPGIDLIAVTIGPGLAPALKIGLQAARELALAWDCLYTPVNHMEGHFCSGLLLNSRGEYYAKPAGKYLKPITNRKQLNSLPRPLLGVLVSGGHTELVLSSRIGEYQVCGQKLDDAAGEAFDKFAVMLNLGYPGGATIEKLAELGRAESGLSQARDLFPLPIPLKGQPGLDFSFSGLKTAAMYLLRTKAGFTNPTNIKQDQAHTTTTLSAKEIKSFAVSFEYSVVTSITLKVERAIKQLKPQLILAGGGVINNKQVRKNLLRLGHQYALPVILPNNRFLTDNAAMIALVGYFNYLNKRHIYTKKQLETNDLLADRIPNLDLGEQLSF